jgi:hypothetical protein
MVVVVRGTADLDRSCWIVLLLIETLISERLSAASEMH